MNIPVSRVNLAKQQRVDAITNIIDNHEGHCAPSLDEIAQKLNEQGIYTAQGYEWDSRALYYELYRNGVKLQDLTDKPIIRGRGGFSAKASLRAEGVERVETAIKRYLQSWGEKRVPRYVEIALHLNCQFIQVSNDDKEWDGDTVHTFMTKRKLERKDFMPIDANDLGPLNVVE